MSKLEVDTIDKQSGSTLTLGGSGTAVTLACGATQSGFGRTGTVDWQTGSIKTSTFTAANGEGYFADTSSTAFTMNLPAGTAGNIVSVVDYTNTFQTNGLTVAPNGSQKIGGVAAPLTLSTEGQSVTFVYVDDTEGWKNVQDSTSNAIGNPFLQASGGTETESGDFKIHTFTGPGTFTVTTAAVSAPNNNVDYLVLAGGGGGGGRYHGAGGGAGGLRTTFPSPGCNAGAFPVSVQAYSIAVGGGGPGGGNDTKGTSGVNSTFSTITSAGGGGGANYGVCSGDGVDGGSGGGASTDGGGGTNTAGAGNTPPAPVSQGNPGGIGNSHSPPNFGTGGGGGIGAPGGNGTNSVGGVGGAGSANSITGSPVTRAGGGGGSAYSSNPASGAGGAGGGGAGTATGTGGNGTDNTGGGGGGAGDTGGTAGNGGSGIVIIRYRFQ